MGGKHSPTDNISRENIYDAITQTCDTHLTVFGLGNKTSDGRTLVNRLEELRVKLDDMQSKCIWRNQEKVCSSILSPILTEGGICFTFNTLHEQEVFRVENLHKEYKYFDHDNQTRSGWDLERGYPAEATAETYPYRVLSSGTRAGLSVMLPLKEIDLDYICSGPVQGFKIHLHTPGEVPRVSHQYIRVPIDQEVIISVKPTMMTTSEGLRGYNPNR